MVLHRSPQPGVFALASIALLMSISGSLAAQEQTLRVDPARSDVQFTLPDPIHSVHGTFHVQSGAIHFDPKESHIGGGIAVDAASGSSGNSTRDHKMTEDQMKAPSFSTVTFQPTRYTGTLLGDGDSTITVLGTFTLLGMPHEISVPMQVHLDAKEGKATGTFVIPFVKWGMKDPSTFLLRVGKEVTVNLVLVGPVSTGHFN